MKRLTTVMGRQHRFWWISKEGRGLTGCQISLEHDDFDGVRRQEERRGCVIRGVADRPTFADVLDGLQFLGHCTAACGTAPGIRAILKMLLAVIVSLKC